MRPGIELFAVAVASGERGVVEDADAPSIIDANEGQPVPLAVHRSGDWCAVLFITKQTNGYRSDIVPVHNGDVGSYGGGEGGDLVRRSQVEPGTPYVEGTGQHFLDDQTGLFEADGVSADAKVRMRWRGEVVAEASVAAHGYFVLTSILPADPEVTVESA